MRQMWERFVAWLSAISLRQFLLGVTGLGLVLRAAALFGLRNIHQPPPKSLGADLREFEIFARSMATGHGFAWGSGAATAFRAPGFPAFLAGFYKLFAPRFEVAYLAILLVSALLPVVCYLLSRRVLSESEARVCALLSVFYVPTIYFATELMSEVLFVPLFGVCLVALIIGMERRSATWVSFGSLLLGACVLTRPFALLCLPVVVLALLVSRQPMRILVCSVLFCVVPVAAWTARNYTVFHRVVLVTTNGGSTFYGANNDIVADVPSEWGSWVSTVELPGRKEIQAQPDEVSHDKLEWKLGEDWVKQHPAKWSVLEGEKLVRFVLPDISSKNRMYDLVQVLGWLPFAVMWIGLAFGTSKRRLADSLRDPKWLLIHGCFAMSVVTALIFWGSPRFRDANAALLMVYAAVGLSSWLGSKETEVQSKDGDSAEVRRAAAA